MCWEGLAVAGLTTAVLQGPGAPLLTQLLSLLLLLLLS